MAMDTKSAIASSTPQKSGGALNAAGAIPANPATRSNWTENTTAK